jgi:hypothetical protein
LTVQASRDPIDPIVGRTADWHGLVLGSFVVIAPENYVANFDRLIRRRELSRLVRRRGAYRVYIDHYGRHTRTPFYRCIRNQFNKSAYLSRQIRAAACVKHLYRSIRKSRAITDSQPSIVAPLG